MRKILVILGTTATGKTDLGINLAKKLKGELVACDSRQVYKGLDIGTGKLPSSKIFFKKNDGFWDLDGTKVWLYDVVSLDTQYTVADYVRDAEKVIEDIESRGKLPIIVGGTGLYLKGLLEGFSNLKVPFNATLRKELEDLSLEELQVKLQKTSKIKWDRLNDSDKQNPRRLIRAIELTDGNFKQESTFEELKNKYDCLKIGLFASREILYARVDERVIRWFKDGIVHEVEDLIKSGISLERVKKLGLEYSLIAEYIGGGIPDIESLIKKIQFKIHGYVRRQETWYKKEKNVNWFDINDEKFVVKIENIASEWYDN